MAISDSALLLIVFLVAIAVSLMKFRSLGRAAFYSIAGFIVLMVACLVDIGYFAWSMYGYDSSGSRETFETVYGFRVAGRLLLHLIGFILLILAIMAKRPDGVGSVGNT